MAMVKSNRVRSVCYFLAANFWFCPAVQAQHVHKTESQRDRLRQHQDEYRHAPTDHGFGVNVAPPTGWIWKHKQPGDASVTASDEVAR